MMSLRRSSIALVAPAALLLSLTACGGDDASDAPESASKEDFCEAYNAEPSDADFDPEASEDEQAQAVIDALKEVSGNLKDVGTPEDIPDDAREGFEVAVNFIDDVEVDDVKDAMASQDGNGLEGLISEEDQAKGKAFEDWATEYCGDEGSDSGSSSDDSTE